MKIAVRREMFIPVAMIMCAQSRETVHDVMRGLRRGYDPRRCIVTGDRHDAFRGPTVYNVSRPTKPATLTFSSLNAQQASDKSQQADTYGAW